MDSSERYEAAIAAAEAMDRGVGVTDSRGRVLYENALFRQQLTGRAVRQPLEDAISDVRQAVLARAREPVALRARPRGTAPAPRAVGMSRSGGDLTLHVSTADGEFEVRGIAVAGAVAGHGRVVVITVRSVPLHRLSPASLHDIYGLTLREARVAALLDAGVHNREIAESLGISVHTVRRHVESVLRKLGIHSRAHVRQRLSD